MPHGVRRHICAILILFHGFQAQSKVHSEAIDIAVKDAMNNPLAGAVVLVEDEGRLIGTFQTNTTGAIHYTGAVTKDTFFTVWKPGYTAVTVGSAEQSKINFQLNKRLSDDRIEYQGKLTGYDDSGSKSRAQLGIVATSFDLNSIVDLATAKFLSPLDDTIHVVVPLSIPSNIVLPDQWVSLNYIPVHVNKPTHRIPVLKKDIPSRLIALSGNGDGKKILDAISAKDYEALFSELNVTRVALGPAANEDGITRDLDANIVIDSSATLKSSGADSENKDVLHLLFSLWEFERGSFLPTDVKAYRNKDTILKVIGSKRSQTRFMDLNVSSDGERYRIAWVNPEKDMIRSVPFSSSFSSGESDGTAYFDVRPSESFQRMVVTIQSVTKDRYGKDFVTDLWKVYLPYKTFSVLPKNAYAYLAETLKSWSASRVELIAQTEETKGQTNLNGYNVIDDVRVLYGISQPR